MIEMPSFRRRVLVAGALIAVFAVILAGRIVYVLLDPSVRLDDGRRGSVRRGRILDATGEILAVSVPGVSVFANPEHTEDPSAVASAIAPILGIDPALAAGRMAMQRKFVWLKRFVSADEAASVQAAKLPGVRLLNEDERAYPQGRLAAHLIGFTGVDGTGLEGAEYRYDAVLTNADASGDIIHGSDIMLSIDRTVQWIAGRELARAVLDRGANQGSAVVIEVNSGRILALAKYPDFDPSRYGSFSTDDRRFFGVTDAFEPGSVMKAFAAAAWLESNPDLKQTWQCSGAVKIGNQVINCTAAHGTVDMNRAITVSCNSGVMSAIRGIPQDRIREMMARMGFGAATGAGVPGEAPGILRDTAKWSGLSKYSISVGQEISVSILQLAAAYASIAAGGVYRAPRIVDAIIPWGGAAQPLQPSAPRRVLTERAAGILAGYLRNVILTGTGRKAGLAHFAAAGKTGTARKFTESGYVENINMSTFVGFAPLEHPEICIAVIIDEPKGVTGGGDVAAPVFAAVADEILLYRGAGARTTGAHSPAVRQDAARKYSGAMPDCTGMRLSGALGVLHGIRAQIPVIWKISGSGTVRAQQPAPGHPLSPGETIQLECSE
jgi:cell division protein FtsI (penicillin-binding protein 3)